MGAFAVSIVGGGFSRCDASWSRPDGYRADHHKLYVPIAGAAEYAVGDDPWFALRPGRVWFVPAHPRHRQRCAREMRIHWFHFVVDSLPLARRLARATTPLSWPVAEWRAWRPTWTRIDAWIADGGAALGARLHALALALSAAAIERTAPAPADDDRAGERFAPALALLERDTTAVPVAHLARAVGLSVVHFHRAFVQAFGVTPHAWKVRRRLERAAALLAGGDRPVGDIAAECGYADPFYFSRAFRAHHRLSPSDYRAARRGEP